MGNTVPALQVLLAACLFTTPPCKQYCCVKMAIRVFFRHDLHVHRPAWELLTLNRFLKVAMMHLATRPTSDTASAFPLKDSLILFERSHL